MRRGCVTIGSKEHKVSFIIQNLFNIDCAAAGNLEYGRRKDSESQIQISLSQYIFTGRGFRVRLSLVLE